MFREDLKNKNYSITLAKNMQNLLIKCPNKKGI